jgi:Right handed beta helix region
MKYNLGSMKVRNFLAVMTAICLLPSNAQTNRQGGYYTPPKDDQPIQMQLKIKRGNENSVYFTPPIDDKPVLIEYERDRMKVNIPDVSISQNVAESSSVLATSSITSNQMKRMGMMMSVVPSSFAAPTSSKSPSSIPSNIAPIKSPAVAPPIVSSPANIPSSKMKMQGVMKPPMTPPSATSPTSTMAPFPPVSPPSVFTGTPSASPVPSNVAPVQPPKTGLPVGVFTPTKAPTLKMKVMGMTMANDIIFNSPSAPPRSMSVPMRPPATTKSSAGSTPSSNIHMQRKCQPTTGSCLSTVASLQTILNRAAPNDVVAICGSTILVTTTAITVEGSGITLCCAGTGTCTFQSSGTDSNLSVYGDSITLQDLIFLDGRANIFFGGNVAIDGGGDHLVVGCEFRDGIASRLGGNLYVQTRDSLTIENTTFIGGRAGEGGGGMYVLNAEKVSVRNCLFSENTAENDGSGGGVFSTLQPVTDYGQEITFEDTIFINNFAAIGGGFFVTQLGIMPSLTIQASTFEGNEGVDTAGAGAIAQSLNDIMFMISDSTSTRNVAPICADILSFFDNNTTGPFCILASDDFP